MQQGGKGAGGAGPDDAPPVVIRKYANRRLYDTDGGCFVTLGDLHARVRRGDAFVVQDARSGQDITCSVLVQIIAEEETKGHNLLPLNCLRHILQAYDSRMGPLFRSYLERSVDVFVTGQRQVSEQVRSLLDDGPPDLAVQPFAELGRRNAEMVRRSMEWWAPPGARRPPGEDRAAAEGADAESREEEIRQLRQRLADVEQRLDGLSRKT